MAHNIMVENGRAAMWCKGTRESAWHHLGQRTTEAQNWQDVIKLAGLDWRVEKRQLYVLGRENVPYPVPHYGIFRINGNGGKFLGAAGEQYTPIQNECAGAMLDTLLEADSGVHYESAGALGNGERIWALATIPASFTIGEGDAHETYLLFATSHDGSLAATVKVCTVRVVCQNTLNVALSGKADNVLRIKHTKDAQRKLDAARSIISGAQQSIRSLEEKLRILSNRQLSSEKAREVMAYLFPKKAEDENGRPTWSTRTENVVEDMLKLYETSSTIQGIRGAEGTAYGLLNAITEWTDHLRGVRQTEGRANMTDAQMRAENALFDQRVLDGQTKENVLNSMLRATV